MCTTKILAAMLVACAAGLMDANQYPAGVDPRSCPNYPDCDNAALHGSRLPANAWNSIASIPTSSNAWDSWDSWNANPSHQSASAVATDHWGAPTQHAADSVGVAARYPAGVNPQSCPNYPNCDNVALHGGAAPRSWGSPGPVAAAGAHWNPHAPVPAVHNQPQYPAGVNAQNCPNYPYCL